MQEELTILDGSAAATVRLLNNSWANYLQRACTRLKSVGQASQTNGTHVLVSRLRRTRPSTYEHSVRVARLARVTGRAFNFTDARLQQLSSTAMLHDIGKILVPEAVLNRPRRPTRMEQFVLHLHPSLGALLATYFNMNAGMAKATRIVSAAKTSRLWRASCRSLTPTTRWSPGVPTPTRAPTTKPSPNYSHTAANSSTRASSKPSSMPIRRIVIVKNLIVETRKKQRERGGAEKEILLLCAAPLSVCLSLSSASLRR
jgi:HD domain